LQNNIKMNLTQGVNWVETSDGRLWTHGMHLRFPQKDYKFLTIWATVSFLTSTLLHSVLCHNSGIPSCWLGLDPMSYGICGGQSDTGSSFLWVLQVPLPILIPPIAPHSLITLLLTLYRTGTAQSI
jgi:hypothetical protein